MTAQILSYKGTTGTYTDIATRGDEILGLALTPVAYGGSVRVEVRFGVRAEGDNFGDLKHFAKRDLKAYYVLGTDGKKTDQKVTVRQLNKLSLKLADGIESSQHFRDFAKVTGLFTVFAEWVAEQAKADGFTILHEDLAAYVTSKIAPEPKATLTISFPDLSEEKESVEAEYAPKPKKSSGPGSMDDSWDEDADEDND